MTTINAQTSKTGFALLQEYAERVSRFTSGSALVEFLYPHPAEDDSFFAKMLSQEPFVLGEVYLSKDLFWAPLEIAFMSGGNPAHEKVDFGFHFPGFACELLVRALTEAGLEERFRLCGDYNGHMHGYAFWDRAHTVTASFYNIRADLTEVNVVLQLWRGKHLCHSLTVTAGILIRK